jgi:hypothetical protein
LNTRPKFGSWVWIATTIALVVATAWVVAIVGVARLVRHSYVDTQDNMRQMRREFALLKPPAGAIMVRPDDGWKLGQGLVGASYRTTSTYDEIRKHYDETAARHGWTVSCEAPLRDWGRDFGGRTRDYRKGPFRGSLQYAGTKADYGWVYAFDVTWGLRSRCQ